MFHLAAWMQDCATQLERMRQGTFDPGEETREAIDRQNDEWFERSRTMDPPGGAGSASSPPDGAWWRGWPRCPR